MAIPDSHESFERTVNDCEAEVRTRLVVRTVEPKLYQINKGSPNCATLIYLVETTGLEPVTPCMSSPLALENT